VWGTIRTLDQARALRALVESAPGVKRVEDYLTCRGELVQLT
jgi:hypothetical protein